MPEVTQQVAGELGPAWETLAGKPTVPFLQESVCEVCAWGGGGGRPLLCRSREKSFILLELRSPRTAEFRAGGTGPSGPLLSLMEGGSVDLRGWQGLDLPSWQQPVWENLKRVGSTGGQVAVTAWRGLGHQWGWGGGAKPGVGSPRTGVTCDPGSSAHV